MRTLVKPIVFLLFMLMLMPLAVQAQDQARTFLAAVEAYDKGDYAAAARGFLSLAEDGVINGKLYYNIANASLKAGDIGQAIRWYEKAHRLIPGDPDLNFNLDYARTRVKDKAPEEVSLPEMLFFWRNWLNPETAILLAAISSLVFCLVAFIRRQTKMSLSVLFQYGFLMLFVFFTLTAAGHFYFDRYLRRGVVLAESVSVKSGFSDLSTELFELHAGSRVTIEKTEQGFYRIRFGKDKIGWVPEKEIGLI